MSPRFPSIVIDQMLARGQITRVAPNRAQSDQLLAQGEAHLRSAKMLRDADTAGAFVLAYDGARKALTAILLNQGLKPRGEGPTLSSRRPLAHRWPRRSISPGSAGCAPRGMPLSTAATGTRAQRLPMLTKPSSLRPPSINVRRSSWTTCTRTEPGHRLGC